MTELHFNIDQISATETEERGKRISIDVISETCFFLPVRLVVNGKDVFRTENIYTKEVHSWIQLPAFSLILYWRECLERLDKVGKERIFLADAGQINLEKVNEQVVVTTNFNDIVATTGYYEFCSSLLWSIENLKSHLKNRFPDFFERKDLRV